MVALTFSITFKNAHDSLKPNLNNLIMLLHCFDS